MWGKGEGNIIQHKSFAERMGVSATGRGDIIQTLGVNVAITNKPWAGVLSWQFCAHGLPPYAGLPLLVGTPQTRLTLIVQK